MGSGRATISSKLVRSDCDVVAGASAASYVMAGPITQVPTNMPTAIAAIAAMSGSDRNVAVCSRWCGKRMRFSEKGNARCGVAFRGSRKIIARKRRLDLRRDLFQTDHARELADFAL